MIKNKIFLICVFVSIVSAFGFAFSAPITTLYEHTADSVSRFVWSLEISMVIVYIGAGVNCLLAARKGGSIWNVWRFLGLMMIFIGIAQAQVPFFGYYGFSQVKWVTSGALAIPYLLSLLFAIIGIRSYLRSIRQRSSLVGITTLVFVAVSSGIIAYAIILLVKPQHILSESLFIAGVVTYSLYGLLAFIMHRFSNVVGGYMKQPFAWLKNGFVVLSIVELQSLYEIFTSNVENFYFHYGIGTFVITIPGWILIYASMQLQEKITQFRTLPIQPTLNSHSSDVMTTSHAPQQEFVQALIDKNTCLLGKEISIKYAHRIPTIHFDPTGAVEKIDDQNETLLALIETYKVLIGEAEIIFAKDLLETFAHRYPEARFPAIA